ncbi:MAG: 3'-5' exonuclease [Streptosporangiales bacterium]|nr:3'-5' exonuclease [Streptosporangiales bacterium]
MDTAGIPWRAAPIVALDLEGSGAQDRDDEAILEIALVPIIDARPALHAAYTTLINPGRPVPRRPWISPGLNDDVLAGAPTIDQVRPEFTARLSGRIIVGHNISVDWRLLHRRCPAIHPKGLVDTLRLARHVHPEEKRHGLLALLHRHNLTGQVTELAPSSQPHRALWDTIGTALLLTALIDSLPGEDTPNLGELLRLAGLPITNKRLGQASRAEPEQTSLLDL